ncbi:PREDICTED: zinc finger protein ZAT5-like [Erythranthe guttata]|nr:PREDICTED: zinc finger protein ZAT5-like [Erythranthe guttata]|eukprot:XP_012837962.1 PREDICTED: zinc finger protein ZAT5-like [Erythranthe guttata]
MANCLILLAQGGGGGGTEGKFSSRRFPEMTAATAAEGKVGVYVYECKTCSRTFPSFQALGGHRASHKKPKPSAAAADVDRKRPPPPAAAPIDQTAEYAPAAPSTQFPKTHECSICGSEFASGQALGGHMRRHRSAATNTNTTSSDIIDAGEKTRNMLELDLNLPAPPEDDRREMKFHRFTPNKQPRLVFSTAALVDCHY